MARSKPTAKSSGSAFGLRTVLISLLVGGAAFGVYKLRNPPQPRVPLRQTQWFYEEDLFPSEVAERLVKRVEEYGVYRTAIDDATSAVEHIGEAAPIDSPACDHPYMTPNKDHTLCMLPQRFDVGRHHLMTGGRTGAKERYDTLVSRITTFLSYIFVDREEDADLREHLFESPRYVELAKQVCQGRELFDNFQVNMVLMLPGQELAMHLDAPWFWGASRWTHPQWLLVVMSQSGLFDELRLPQIQGIVWMHNDGTANNSRGGEFYFYPQGSGGPSVQVNSKFNAMLVADGCQVPHGVRRFKPEAKVPLLDRRSVKSLEYKGDHVWHLISDGRKIGEYTTEQMRVTLVWRARCFRDAEEKARWEASEVMQLDDILDKLEADLRARGRLAKGEPRPAPFKFAELLLDEYGRYPIETDLAWIPYNYCAADRLLPAWARPYVDPLLSLICD